MNDNFDYTTTENLLSSLLLLLLLLLSLYYYYYYHHYYSLHVKLVLIGQIIHLQLIFINEFRCVRLHNKCNVTIQNYL